MVGWQHSGIAGSGLEDGMSIRFGDSASVDAMARLRVSMPFVLFDSKQVWNDPDLDNDVENFPLFWDNQETSGSGTTTLFNVNRASTTLGVSSLTAGIRVRQTKQRFNYQPGKAMQVLLTGATGDTNIGVTKRFGYFDEDNGLFFQNSNGVISVVVRSSVTGFPVDTVVNQDDWNLNNMKGKSELQGGGRAATFIEMNNVQILLIDFEWLGAGRIRFGVLVNGIPIYVHEIINFNVLESVYMSTPNLPIRVEISNDGTGGADTYEQICVSVISESGVQQNGSLRFESIETSTISAGNSGTTYAICGIRLKSNYLSADVRESFSSVIENSGANNPFLWKLHMNPTLTTGITYTAVPNSAIEFGAAIMAGDIITNDGIVISGGYQARQDANASMDLESAPRLGSLIDGTPDQLILSGTPLGMNQTYLGGIQWREAW